MIYFQVISTVVYTAVFWAVDRVVDADEQYSVSFFRNHLFHFIFPGTFFSHEVGCWQWLSPPISPEGDLP